jgi:hypothetical protein
MKSETMNEQESPRSPLQVQAFLSHYVLHSEPLSLQHAAADHLHRLLYRQAPEAQVRPTRMRFP